jgi:hypothetical protein
MTHPTRCAVHPYRARPVKRSPHRSGPPRTGRINLAALPGRRSPRMVRGAYGSAMGRETGAGCVDRLLFVVGTRKSVSLSIPKLTPWA